MELVQLLGHGDPGNAMYTGELAAFGAGNMALLVFCFFVFFPLASGTWLQRASLSDLSLLLRASST